MISSKVHINLEARTNYCHPTLSERSLDKKVQQINESLFLSSAQFLKQKRTQDTSIIIILLMMCLVLSSVLEIVLLFVIQC